jgi:hypothetical protein
VLGSPLQALDAAERALNGPLEEDEEADPDGASSLHAGLGGSAAGSGGSERLQGSLMRQLLRALSPPLRIGHQADERSTAGARGPTSLAGGRGHVAPGWPRGLAWPGLATWPGHGGPPVASAGHAEGRSAVGLLSGVGAGLLALDEDHWARWEAAGAARARRRWARDRGPRAYTAPQGQRVAVGLKPYGSPVSPLDAPHRAAYAGGSLGASDSSADCSPQRDGDAGAGPGAARERRSGGGEDSESEWVSGRCAEALAAFEAPLGASRGGGGGGGRAEAWRRVGAATAGTGPW